MNAVDSFFISTPVKAIINIIQVGDFVLPADKYLSQLETTALLYMGPALFDGLVVLKQDWVCQIDT
jgi:hypothetical protein